MTDEQIFQIFRKHVMGYTPELARHPYGWLTAFLDAQKEIMSQAMRLDSIGFAEWISVNSYIEVDGDYNIWSHGEIGEETVTTDQLYNEYLEFLKNGK